jgi:uncharacterized protein
LRRTRTRASRTLPSAAVALTLALTACGAASKPTPSPTPSPAPQKASGPRVVMPSASVYTAELARTPEEQAQGLMFRESLPPRHGMLFLFGEPGVHKFWMKNTMIPLDMVWLDREGRVVFVSADTPPCKADPCPSYGPDTPAVTVLEIAGGMAAKEKVVPGALLKLIDVQ